MWPALITVLAVAVCIGMLVVANRMEPHWVAKDHRRFLTTSEEVDPLGTVIGRRKEVKGLSPTTAAHLRHRAVMRSTSVVYAIQAKSPRPPAGKALYVLRPIPPADDGSLPCCASRPPASSSACSTHSAPMPAPTPATSPLPHLIHELGDRRTELIEVDQEGVVPVR